MSISVYRVTSPEEAGNAAADRIDEVVRAKPDAVLGVATGSTPLPVYTALGRRAAVSDRYRGLSVFALDEYVGLPPGHPESYRSVVMREVAEPLGLASERVHVPEGSGLDPHAEARTYEELRAEAGGVELQLLGIGSNGHLAFNEPGSPFESRTRVVELTEQTRRDNSRFFDGDVEAVPRQAITQGLATIMESRELILLALGEAKARVLAQALHEEPTPELPASVIQNHPQVTVLVDAEAGKLL